MCELRSIIHTSYFHSKDFEDYMTTLQVSDVQRFLKPEELLIVANETRQDKTRSDKIRQEKSIVSSSLLSILVTISKNTTVQLHGTIL